MAVAFLPPPLSSPKCPCSRRSTACDSDKRGALRRGEGGEGGVVEEEAEASIQPRYGEKPA